MDDLKTYVKNDQELTGLLTIEKGFSDDIKMVFGLDKNLINVPKPHSKKENFSPLKTSKLTKTPLSKI